MPSTQMPDVSREAVVVDSAPVQESTFTVVNNAAFGSLLDAKNLDVVIKALNDFTTKVAQKWGLPSATVSAASNFNEVSKGSRVIVVVGEDSDIKKTLAYGSAIGYVRSATILSSGGHQTYGNSLRVPTVAQSIAQEIASAMVDPDGSKYVRRPDGTMLAVEVSDPVQRTVVPYMVRDSEGQQRIIGLSDFVLPAYYDFTYKGPARPVTYVGELSTPGAIASGGATLAITSDSNGKVIPIFGSEQAGYQRKQMMQPFGRRAARLQLSQPAPIEEVPCIPVLW